MFERKSPDLLTLLRAKQASGAFMTLTTRIGSVATGKIAYLGVQEIPIDGQLIEVPLTVELDRSGHGGIDFKDVVQMITRLSD